MTLNSEQRKKLFLLAGPPALLGLVSVVLGVIDYRYLSALFFLFFIAWTIGISFVLKRKLDQSNKEEQKSS